jgi:hypothetical protein
MLLSKKNHKVLFFRTYINKSLVIPGIFQFMGTHKDEFVVVDSDFLTVKNLRQMSQENPEAYERFLEEQPHLRELAEHGEYDTAPSILIFFKPIDF